MRAFRKTLFFQLGSVTPLVATCCRGTSPNKRTTTALHTLQKLCMMIRWVLVRMSFFRLHV